MNDRELLEMAAKAAGIVLGEHARFIGDHPQLWFYNDSRKHPMCRKPSRAGNVPWNPRTNDGDALRLAVRLRIDVAHTNIHSPQVHALADAKVQVWEEISADPYAATRRAIIRAAAEIGRSIASASEAAPNGEKP